jgi:hypothetical protein
MIKLPVGQRITIEPEGVVTVGFPGEVEIEYTGIVAALKDERGSLHLKKSNGNFIEISPSFLYFEIGKEQ